MTIDMMDAATEAEAEGHTRHYTFFALPSPSNPDAMTFWRRDRKGRRLSYIAPWPSRASYGPVVPEHLEANPLNWAIEVGWPWQKALRVALYSDLDGCAARFTILTGRCCACGRLTDTEGVCTKCQAKVPAEVTRRVTDNITKQQER